MRNKSFKYIILGIAACLLLTGCHPKIKIEQTDRPVVDSTSASVTGATTDDQKVPGPVEPEMLNFNYGRLTLNERFLKENSNGVDITLNFEKKIFTPGEDIVLTVYAANYTGDALKFVLQDPIVSRQQLIHASLTYGSYGQYSVPVTVDFKQEKDLVGGKFEVEVRNRKLLAATVTFHTSTYENIEESIFSRDYANTYEMNFWFGEDEYQYSVDSELTYASIDWSDPTQIQSLEFPEQFTSTVGNVQFSISFNQRTYGTDDDIRLHVKVRNNGREPLVLYSASDISKPMYYIRAAMACGSNPVRDNVAAASEIAGIESEYLLKYQDELERDITFYTSEFTAIARSVYHHSRQDQCALKIWLMAKDQTYEILVPITYTEYEKYSYHDREVPPIVTVVPELTTVVTTTTAPAPVEPSDEPEETTEIPYKEEIAEPAETTVVPNTRS